MELSKKVKEQLEPQNEEVGRRFSSKMALVEVDGCFCCGELGHGKQQCPFIKHTCALCCEEGHLERRCRNTRPSFPVKGEQCYCFSASLGLIFAASQVAAVPSTRRRSAHS